MPIENRIRPTKMAECTTCGIILPIVACELCAECHCEAHIVRHISAHFKDAEMFKTAEKLAELGIRLVQ